MSSGTLPQVQTMYKCQPAICTIAKLLNFIVLTCKLYIWQIVEITKSSCNWQMYNFQLVASATWHLPRQHPTFFMLFLWTDPVCSHSFCPPLLAGGPEGSLCSTPHGCWAVFAWPAPLPRCLDFTTQNQGFRTIFSLHLYLQSQFVKLCTCTTGKVSKVDLQSSTILWFHVSCPNVKWHLATYANVQTSICTIAKLPNVIVPTCKLYILQVVENTKLSCYWQMYNCQLGKCQFGTCTMA